MIALPRGIPIEKHPNQAIVETGGVGYDVAIPVSTFTRLPDAGAEVRLRIHGREVPQFRREPSRRRTFGVPRANCSGVAGGASGPAAG